MTLHAAKGLEFPVVFIIGLEQGLLPHSRSSDSDAELEEERRLLFVGITRARRELTLSHCRIREFRGSRSSTIPSLFLGELPMEGMTERDFSEFGGREPQSLPRFLETRRGVPATPAFRLTTAAELAAGTLASPSNDELAVFRPGLTVRHPEYGLGRIVAIDGAGANRKGRVAFTVGGERTFVLAKSPLKPVGR
jgi:DNA helicase-2/ATP-dependent DNA helicase PcrA